MDTFITVSNNELIVSELEGLPSTFARKLGIQCECHGFKL